MKDVDADREIRLPSLAASPDNRRLRTWAADPGGFVRGSQADSQVRYLNVKHDYLPELSEQKPLSLIR